MRVVIQRVSEASVRVEGELLGRIDRGLLVLLAIGPQDGEAQITWMARKLAGLRIFPDAGGKMNLSLVDEGLGALVISQFTLYGDCRKGRRPSFVDAAPPKLAEPAYDAFCSALAEAGVAPVERGRFAADMKVQLVNDGPVTLVIDSP